MLNRIGCASLLVLVCSGCVTVQEFRELERAVVELERGGAVDRGDASYGGSSPAGLPERGSSARLAELAAEVAELQQEVARLKGDLEVARHTSEQALSESQATRRAVSQAGSPSVSSSAQGREAPGSRADDSYGSGETAASGPVTGAALSSEVRDYEEAFRLYRASQYQRAIDRFRSFLQTHPSSDYADNALFWLGECHFKLGDYEQSVLAFDDVIKRFPEGNKLPDALYRQGIALLELGQREGQLANYQPAACQSFERVVNEYPESDRVREAQRQIGKLCK